MFYSKKFANLLQLLAISAIWLLIGWMLHSWYSHSKQATSWTSETHLIEQARSIISRDQYLDDSTTSWQLAYAAIRGMLAQIDDPNAVLFVPPASEYYDEDIAGEVGVSGVMFDIVDKQVVILDVPPGLPAASTGIQAGDIVLGIDGVTFDETTTKAEVSLLFHGPIGTTAQVMVQRNDQILEYGIVRAELPIFVTQIVGDGIGYLRQRLFPLNAEKEMSKHLQTFLDQHVQALIWDLRNSRGGSMLATEAILNHFIDEGNLYIAEFKDGRRQTFSAKGGALVSDLPLVVLIDKSTYSASEMAALALAEHQRAILIGTRTEGKGTLQDTVALDERHLLRITIGKWLSPSGKWVQDEGVIPDFEMIDDPETASDEALDFAIQYINQEFLSKTK